MNLWWISSKGIMEVGNITEAAIFKNVLHLNHKNTQLLFLWQYFLLFFMRKKITNDFWGLHKNMICAFPLKIYKKISTLSSIEIIFSFPLQHNIHQIKTQTIYVLLPLTYLLWALTWQSHWTLKCLSWSKNRFHACFLNRNLTFGMSSDNVLYRT